MKELIDEDPPSIGAKNFNAQRYLNRMFKDACEELGVEPESSKKESKKKEESTPDFVEKVMKGKVTLDDAIDLAMKGILIKKEE